MIITVPVIVSGAWQSIFIILWIATPKRLAMTVHKKQITKSDFQKENRTSNK